MSKGSQSFLEGEFLCTDGEECLPPLVPSRGLPRRILRAAIIHREKPLNRLCSRTSEEKNIKQYVSPVYYV